MSNLGLVFMLSLLVGLSSALAQTHKGISFQGVVKLPSGEYPTRSGLTVNARILSPNNCILREEQFSGVNISNGYVNIAIGTGTTGGYDPGLTMKQVMNNSQVINSLSCLNIDGTVNGGVTSFNPATTNGARKFRLSLMIDSVPVVADFNMRSMAYAVNAESLNGKTEADLVNTSTSITQSAVETWFSSAVMGQLLGGTFVAPSALTAMNVTGTVAVANGGTGATTASGALANLLPFQGGNGGKFLTSDGSNVSWATIPSSPVSSVAGRTGAVTLGVADLSNFDTGVDNRILAQKGQSSGLATLDISGHVPSSQLSLTSSDIPSLDAAKITSGTIDAARLPASLSPWQAGSGNIYYNSGNVGIGTDTPGALLDIYGGSLTVRSGSVTPISNISGGVISSIGTDAAPGYFKAASWSSLPTLGQVVGGYRFGSPISDFAKIEGLATENHNPGKGTALRFFTTPNGASSLIESLRIDSDGNVGIGATNPGAKLEVAGQLKITGGSPGTGKVLTSDASGLATWEALPAGTSGTVTGVTSGNSYLTVTNGSVAPVITANVGTAANTLAAGDDSRFTNSRTPTGSAGGDLSGTYPNPTVAKINGNAVASTTPASGQVMVWNAGQYSPVNFGVSHLLSATGVAQFANSSCTASQTLTWSSLTDTFTCANITGLNASAITAGTIDSARLPASATAWVDGGSGKLYYNGGNVGIGTTTPTSKLHIVNGTNVVRVNDGAGAVTPNISIESTVGKAMALVAGSDGSAFTFDNSGNFYIGGDSHANIADGTTSGGTYYMTISDAGKVGIGTVTPGSALEINAPVAAAFGVQMKVTDGSTGGYWSLSEGATGASVYLPTYEFRSAGLNGFGGVLVGKIPAANDVYTANYAAIALDGRIDGGGALVNSNLLSVRNNGVSVATVKASGNVGIGTTDPKAKLDVSGEVRTGNSGLACSATTEGAQRYNSTDKVMEYCNGTVWTDFSPSGTQCGAVDGSGSVVKLCKGLNPTTSCPANYSKYELLDGGAGLVQTTCIKQ